MTEHHSSHPFALPTAVQAVGSWLLSACLSTAGAQARAPEVPVILSENPLVVRAPLTLPQASTAWQQLSPLQKEALAPLGAQWGALTIQQQNKWLAISKNYARLSMADQVTMHERMSNWVALSPQQRHLARLNFNTLQNLPKEDKKAKWEAYQALPAEKKRLLSEGSKPLPKNAAPTAKPLEARRQVQTPEKPTNGQTPPPSAIDRKTLLPRTPALASPAHNAPFTPPT
jgi:Protein of unknown function (DUF3106)